MMHCIDLYMPNQPSHVCLYLSSLVGLLTFNLQLLNFIVPYQIAHLTTYTSSLCPVLHSVEVS